MPQLFIYNETIHESYMVLSEGVRITDVIAKHRRIEKQIECKENDEGLVKCAALITNGCSDNGKN